MYKIPTSETPEETPERYTFYCYHETYPVTAEDESDDCEYSVNDGDCLGQRATYNADNIPADLTRKYFCRQQFNAWLRPSTQKKYNSCRGMYALANLCLWGEQDVDFDDLNEDECVEDACEDVYVCYDSDDNESDAFSFFRKNRMRCTFSESTNTAFAEWRDPVKHV